MYELVDLALPWLVGLFAAMGLALVGNGASKGFTGWLGEVLVNIPIAGPLSLKAALRLNEWIANQLHPIYGGLETRVTHWLNGLGQTFEYQQNLNARQAASFAGFVAWYQTKGSAEILKKADAQARTAFQKNALTKAPTIPQKWITQKEVDIEFQRLIETQFVTHLKDDFPKFDWDKSKWRWWLGVLPALGGAVVTGPPKPRTKPVPAPVKTVKPTVPIAPPQPTTLPRTDDAPHPEPGTQVVPGVLPAKDKWARGQIVRLKNYEESTRKHLGPLAFLALPAAGIATLIGLLECKNFGRFARGICSIPTNLFNDLLGLLLDTLILADICDVITLVQDAFALVEGPLADFIGDVGGALCHGDYQEQVWGGLLYSTPAPELNTLAL